MLQRGWGRELEQLERTAESLAAAGRSKTVAGTMSVMAEEANKQADLSPGAAGSIGRGIGTVGAFVPLIAAGPGGTAGLIAATTQVAAQAESEARQTTETQLRAAGVTDEAEISKESAAAGSDAATYAALTMPAYMMAGRAVAGATGSLMAKASPVARTVGQGVTATGANVAVGSVMRVLEGQEAAPNLEQFTADALWGAIHSMGVNASERARSRAEAELRSRGWAQQDISNPNPETFSLNMAKYGMLAPKEAPAPSPRTIET
jgi:hypothetical protein